MSVSSVVGVSSFLKDLVLAGAQWQPFQPDDPVRILSGVSYAEESPYQSLDLFFPTDFVAPMMDNEDDKDEENATDSNDIVTTSLQERPVFVFIHGGGWSRGGKDNRFYGAPSMCKNMAASYGSISVSIGYRLGNYPDFMNDASQGIRWVQENIATLGGDPQKVFLSGHSAGAHIASLLMIRFDRFLEPVSVRRDFFRGVVLLSGVYDLFCPMKKSLMDAKNKAFVLAYVVPAFGYDEQLRRNASPLLLLHPEKDTSLLGTGPLALLKRLSYTDIMKSFALSPTAAHTDNPETAESIPTAENDEKEETTDTVERSSESEETPSPVEQTAPTDHETEASTDILNQNEGPPSREAETPETPNDSAEEENDTDKLPSSNEDVEGPSAEVEEDESPIRTDLPPTLLLNAWFDMGLEENGQLMTEAMKEHGIDATHMTIPSTDHASICWNQKTIDVVMEFLTHTTNPRKDNQKEEENEAEEAEKTCEAETVAETQAS